MTPTISVIVPVYNVEKWLGRCVDSILAQTFADFELLLIDDGSKDSSGAICDEYATKDERIRVFHKPNGGVSSARNLGLDNARGEWITFCDADDYVHDHWLEAFITNAIKTDLVITGFEIIDQRSGAKRFCGEDLSGSIESCFDKITNCEMQGSLGNKLFKAKFINEQKLRLDRNIRLREDEEFVFKYLTYCNIVKSIDCPTYVYIEPDWANKYIENLDETIYLYESLFNSLIKFENSEEIKSKSFYCGHLTDLYIKKISKAKWFQDPESLARIRQLINISYEIHPMKSFLKRFVVNCRNDFFASLALTSYLTIRGLLKTIKSGLKYVL